MAAGIRVDGVLVDKLAAKVSLLDHGLLFGDGVTAGTRLVAGVPVRLDAHLALLELTAAAIRLKLPYPRAGFVAAVNSAIQVSGRTEGYIKIVVTRGAGMLGVDPRKCEPCVAVIVEDLLPYPNELRDAGLSLATATSVVRRPGHAADLGFTLANPVAVAAMHDALAAGCFDALVLAPDGTVTGATTGAVFAVVGDELRTPPADACPDPVVRAAVLTLAPALGLTPRDAGFTPAELAAADEVFIAGSGFGIVGVRRIDGVEVRQGGVTRRAAAAVFGGEPPV